SYFICSWLRAACPGRSLSPSCGELSPCITARPSQAYSCTARHETTPPHIPRSKVSGRLPPAKGEGRAPRERTLHVDHLDGHPPVQHQVLSGHESRFFRSGEEHAGRRDVLRAADPSDRMLGMILRPQGVAGRMDPTGTDRI